MRGMTSLYSSGLPLQSCTASLGAPPISARNRWEGADAGRVMERIFQPIAQEQGSGIKAVDVVHPL
jgi:hypothetical protein